MNVLGQFLVVAVVFGVMDGIWLTLAGSRVYRPRLGRMMADRPNAPAAGLFYVIYVGAIVYFALRPALADASLTSAVVHGAALGLTAYATWNLTNAAALRDFPTSIIPIDMAWGTLATGSATAASYLVCANVDWLS